MGLVGIFSSSPVTGVRKARLTPILLLRIKLLIHPRRPGPVHKAGRSKASGRAECAGDSNLTHSLRQKTGISLVAQWLRFHTPIAGSLSLIPGRRTRIPHARMIPSCWNGDPKQAAILLTFLLPFLLQNIF